MQTEPPQSLRDWYKPNPTVSNPNDFVRVGPVLRHVLVVRRVGFIPRSETHNFVIPALTTSSRESPV